MQIYVASIKKTYVMGIDWLTVISDKKHIVMIPKPGSHVVGI